MLLTRAVALGCARGITFVWNLDDHDGMGRVRRGEGGVSDGRRDDAIRCQRCTYGWTASVRPCGGTHLERQCQREGWDVQGGSSSHRVSGLHDDSYADALICGRLILARLTCARDGISKEYNEAGRFEWSKSLTRRCRSCRGAQLRARARYLIRVILDAVDGVCVRREARRRDSTQRCIYGRTTSVCPCEACCMATLAVRELGRPRRDKQQLRVRLARAMTCTQTLSSVEAILAGL